MQKANPTTTKRLREIFLANPKCGINKARTEAGGGSNVQIKEAKEWAIKQSPGAAIEAQKPRAKATRAPKKQKPRGKKAKATAKRVQKPRVEVPKRKHVWERQPKESDPAFEAFRTYLNMGDSRSQEAVAKILSKSRQLMRHWSQRHGWVKRAGASDAYKAKQAYEAEVKEEAKRAVERVRRRQKSIDEALSTSGALRICAAKHLVRLSKEEKVRMGDVTQALKTSFEMERIALEMALGKIQHEHAGKDGGAIDITNKALDEIILRGLFPDASQDEGSGTVEQVDAGSEEAVGVRLELLGEGQST